jgi:hypothetical protein
MHYTATRLIVLSAAMITLTLLIHMAQPWGENYAYQNLWGYFLLLGFAVWATLPYLMILFLARKACASGANNLLVLIGALVISLGGVALYIDAVLLHRDPQGGLAFIAVPGYQWIVTGFLITIHFILGKKQAS